MRRAVLLGVPGLLTGSRQNHLPPVAFHYAAIFPPEHIAWYCQFEILVTGGILSRDQTQRLRDGGAAKLIAYEWTSGFYPGDPVSASLAWQDEVQRHVDGWLLTRAPAFGGAADGGKAALWYDFGDPDLVRSRARHLAQMLRDHRYNGFFFDTPGSEYLPQQVLAEFRRRHPGLDYDHALGGFFAAVRAALPQGSLIFLNQGYRHALEFLPYADLDLTESYFTAAGPARTVFRPWHDAARPWESIRTPLTELVLPALRPFARVRMVHVNYAAGDPGQVRAALLYSYCGAKLFGHDAYLIHAPDASLERSSVYIDSLGSPSGEYVEEPGTSIVWRPYEGGAVVIQSGGPPARIAELGVQSPGGFQGLLIKRP